MFAIAYYFLQVILCSAVMMGYYWLVLRNSRFHQYNRFYLLVVLLLSWIVPLIKIQWSHTPAGQDLQVLQFLSIVANNNSQLDDTITRKGFEWNWTILATGIYILVAVILLFGMLRAFFRLYRLLKTHSCKRVGDVYLILTQAKGTPFSFFRYIFWNEEIDISSEAGKQILAHEFTHVQQKHSVDKVCIQLILVAGWFNPFFWLLRKEMDLIHEFIADKKAVNNGDTASLAQMLLTAAYPRQQFALVNSFFFSPIKRRIQMLTNNQHPRFSYFRRLIVLPLLAIVIVLFAFRNKEQGVNGTISVASVMENVIKLDKETGFYQQAHDNNHVQTKLNLSELGFDTIIIKQTEKNGTLKMPLTSKNNLEAKALIIVDGKKVDNHFIETLNPNLIESVNILKNEAATNIYGQDGKDGVVLITTKEFSIQEKLKKLQIAQTDIQQEIENLNVIKKDSAKTDRRGDASGIKITDTIINKSGERTSLPPMILVDGTKVASLASVNQSDIYAVSVWKDQEAIRLYGDEGKNGVVEIITKQLTSPREAGNFMRANSSPVVIPPSFPGGLAAWTKYLNRNIDKDVVKKHGGPPGKYTVVVSFMVVNDGNINTIHAQNDPGYGAKEEAVRLISKGPKWEPAMENGKPINFQHTITISFWVK